MSWTAGLSALCAAIHHCGVVPQPFRAHDRQLLRVPTVVAVQAEATTAAVLGLVVEIPVLFATGTLALSALALEADGRFPLRVPTFGTRSLVLSAAVSVHCKHCSVLPPPHQHPPRARLDLPSGPKLRRRGLRLVHRTAGGTSPCACHTAPA
jgi:hypothetical protein